MAEKTYRGMDYEEWLKNTYGEESIGKLYYDKNVFAQYQQYLKSPEAQAWENQYHKDTKATTTKATTTKATTTDTIPIPSTVAQTAINTYQSSQPPIDENAINYDAYLASGSKLSFEDWMAEKPEENPPLGTPIREEVKYGRVIPVVADGEGGEYLDYANAWNEPGADGDNTVANWIEQQEWLLAHKEPEAPEDTNPFWAGTQVGGDKFKPDFTSQTPWGGLPSDYAGFDTFKSTEADPTGAWGENKGTDFSGYQKSYTDPQTGKIMVFNYDSNSWQVGGMDPTWKPSLTPYEEKSFALQEQQFAWQQQQSQLEAAEKERQYKSQLAANPLSWLEYAAYTKEQPAVQPWMMPLQQKDYGWQTGQAIQGFSPEGGGGMPDLATPSTQMWARMGPTAQQQYQGYQQYDKAQRPEETQFRLGAQTAPAGRNYNMQWMK